MVMGAALMNWGRAPNIVRIGAGRDRSRVGFSSRHWPIDPDRSCSAFLRRVLG